MKNYITVAALFIAGTAFVNATDLTLENAVGYLSYKNGALTPSSSDFSLSGTMLTLSGDKEWAKVVTTDRGRSVGTMALTFDSEKLFEKISSSDQLLAAFDGSLGDLGIGLSSEGKFTGTWANNYKYFESGIAVAKEGGLLSVVLSMGSSGSRIWGDADTNFYSKGELKGGLGTVKSIQLSEVALATLNNIVIWDVDSYNDKVAVAGAFSATRAAIPEPSTFGLFAGLGALCLVGTRRLRRP